MINNNIKKFNGKNKQYYSFNDCSIYHLMFYMQYAYLSFLLAYKNLLKLINQYYNLQSMSLFGVQLNHQINRLITQIRLQLNKQKFIPNVRTLYRSFATYDTNITGSIQLQHFEKALGENGIFFKKHEFQIFQKAFGQEKGIIGWFQFLKLVKNPLNPMRRQLVEDIFDYLKLQEPELTANNISKHFNPQGIQLYDSKKVSKEYLQNQLVSLLSLPEGHLTREEFIAFYDDLNVNYPHDEPFAKYVSKQWGYTFQKGEQVTEQSLRQIIKGLRFKLIQKSKGTNDEFLMKKLFDQFDQNRNGRISSFELDLMLKKLQLPIQAKAVEPLLKKLDKNNSGFIQYDEFKRFIFFDPFPA